jgi:hypothetical protein
MLDPTPQARDSFHCPTCGMELECTRSCGCTDPAMVTLSCCGKDLTPGPLPRPWPPEPTN